MVYIRLKLIALASTGTRATAEDLHLPSGILPCELGDPRGDPSPSGPVLRISKGHCWTSCKKKLKRAFHGIMLATDGYTDCAAPHSNWSVSRQLRTGIIFSTNGSVSRGEHIGLKQAAVLEQFGARKINLILATAVTEEGMDIPAVTR
jgi:hypothetical protein